MKQLKLKLFYNKSVPRMNWLYVNTMKSIASSILANQNKEEKLLPVRFDDSERLSRPSFFTYEESALSFSSKTYAK